MGYLDWMHGDCLHQSVPLLYLLHKVRITHAHYLTDGHSPYTPSSTNFSNSTKQDNLVYGSGGPDNTLGTWRVNDTLSFGNATINVTTFGAAYSLPSGGEGMDGNFGMAKGCANLCCYVLKPLMLKINFTDIAMAYHVLPTPASSRPCMKIK